MISRRLVVLAIVCEANNSSMCEHSVSLLRTQSCSGTACVVDWQPGVQAPSSHDNMFTVNTCPN
jgi:hypothetical protein